MRKQFCLFLLLLFVAELAVLWHFAMQDYDEVQDAVAVNEVIHTWNMARKLKIMENEKYTL